MKLLHLRYNPEDDDSTDDGTNQRSDPSVGLNAKEAEQPAAEHCTNDAQEEVNKHSFSVTALQFARNKTGEDTGNDPNDEFHKVVFVG